MPIVADASAAVRADLNPFIKDLKGADKHVQSLGDRMKAALSPKALVGGLAGGFAATQVIGFLTDATQAASNLGETVSKVGQIFGDEAVPALEEWAEGAAEAFGQSKQQALDAAATFAIFGKSAGLAGDDLVGFSKELTELSSDFASFFNTSPEDAILAIGAALRGESEPIRKYGVLLDEATLRQRALKLGIIQTITQALTPQQRVLAAQAEILAQTSDAQGDFQRTSDGLANQQRILAAELANVQVELGEKLLPIFLELTHFAIDVLVPALSKIIEVVMLIPNALSAAGDEVRKFLGIPQEQQGLGLDKLIESWMDAIIGRDFKTPVVETAAQIREGFVETLEEAAPAIKQGANVAFSPIHDEIVAAREKAAEEARAIPGEVGKALIQGQKDVEEGLDSLLTLMDETLSDAEEMARLRGIRTAIELSGGLTDERASVRDAARALYEDTRHQLSLLTTGAADIAVDTGTTLAETLRQQKLKTVTAASDLAQGTMQALEMDGATPGRELGESWAAGVAAGILKNYYLVVDAGAAVRNVLDQAGAAPKPSTPKPSAPKPPPAPVYKQPLPFALGAWEIPRNMLADLHRGEMVIPEPYAEGARRQSALGGGTVINNFLNIEGERPVVSTAVEIAEQAARLGRFRG